MHKPQTPSALTPFPDESVQDFKPPWGGLLIAPYNQQAAMLRFQHMVGDGCVLMARSPHNPLHEQIPVHFAIPERMKHFLFKDEDDEGGRMYPHSELDDHYLKPRAERLLWIEHALRNPDRLFWIDQDGCRKHYYACGVSEHEEFVVVVREVSRKQYQFITAIPYERARWFVKKGTYRAGPACRIKNEGPP